MLWNVNECGKIKVVRISRQSSRAQIMIHQKQLENLEYFKYLISMITNYSRYAHEIKAIISMKKAGFNRKPLFTNKLDLNYLVLHLE
jgi:hypothetical protein